MNRDDRRRPQEAMSGTKKSQLQALLEVDNFDTDRLSLRSAKPEDASVVRPIYVENGELFRRIGIAATPDSMARDVVQNETLPPGGARERARSFVIDERERPEAVGVLGFYVGYPTASTLYIGALFLRPAWHRRGLGREVIEEMERRARESSVTDIRLAIDSGNWSAFRFWVRLGYDRISKIVDVSESAADPPRIELKKPLSSRMDA